MSPDFRQLAIGAWPSTYSRGVCEVLWQASHLLGTLRPSSCSILVILLLTETSQPDASACSPQYATIWSSRMVKIATILAITTDGDDGVQKCQI